MYGRWLKLLIFLMGLSVLSFFYFSDKSQAAWVVADECMDYLRSDTYWLITCDDENPTSRRSLEANWRVIMLARATATLFVSFALLGSIALSLLGRWLFTGGLR